jgi:hypothetical protein
MKCVAPRVAYSWVFSGAERRSIVLNVRISGGERKGAEGGSVRVR